MDLLWFLAGLVAGLLLAWVAEWLVDWRFRRRLQGVDGALQRDMQAALAAANAELHTLRQANSVAVAAAHVNADPNAGGDSLASS